MQVILGLDQKPIIVPEETDLHQNYPNPFNPSTTVKYDIGLMDGLEQRVSVNVYNVLGQHVTTCLLYTSPSPRDKRQSRMPSSA